MAPPADRRDDSVVLAMMQTIHADVKAMDAKLTDHINTEPDEWMAVMRKLQEDAFPAGDPEGHRKAHEEQMQSIHDRAEFWKKMAFEVTKYGVLGVLGWLAYHAWVAFIHGPGK